MRNSGADGCMTERRRIRPPTPLLHIRKLIPQTGNTALPKTGCDCLHGRVLHPRAGAMCQNEYRTRSARPLEQPRHAVTRTDSDRQGLRADDRVP